MEATREDVRTCADCGAPELEPHSLEHVSNPFDWDGSARVCKACFIKRWPCPIRFVFHFGIPAELRAHFESAEMLRKLQRWFESSRPFLVHVFHRREAETIAWQYKWDRYRSGRPIEPYSYRGFCSGEHIVILYDETETLESIEWILYHELGHHACHSMVRMFDEAMDRENSTEARGQYDWKDDAAHEADSEERLVNRIATAHMGGKEYARPWWRPRVRARLAGEQLLPDPHAAPQLPSQEDTSARGDARPRTRGAKRSRCSS